MLQIGETHDEDDLVNYAEEVDKDPTTKDWQDGNSFRMLVGTWELARTHFSWFKMMKLPWRTFWLLVISDEFFDEFIRQQDSKYFCEISTEFQQD